MTPLEAIPSRHLVRRHKDTPLPEIVVNTLQQKISKINAEGGLYIRLITNKS